MWRIARDQVGTEECDAHSVEAHDGCSPHAVEGGWM
eukprot:gene12606-53965_t